MASCSSKNKTKQGRLGDSVSYTTNFSSGHDLAVHEFKPHVGFCAGSSEPGACFRFCVCLSLCPGCVTLGKVLNPSEPQLPALQNEFANSPNLREVKETMHRKHFVTAWHEATISTVAVTI